MCKCVIKIILLLVIMQRSLFGSDDFVKVIDSRFHLRGKEFRFLGFNAYYLQSEAARGNYNVVDDVFRTAAFHGFKVVRTWAFYESDDMTQKGVIQYSPGEYSEEGLKALDYVVNKAKEYDIKLILTLSNNYSDFGGVPQYIKWANQRLPHPYYKPFEHGDFFTNDSLKGWFRQYVSFLLERKNSITGTAYKDESGIFAFELMNEGDNPGSDGSVLLNWYDEISSYIKTIDLNHIITTGETGYDLFEHRYSDIRMFYNGRDFLFNGYKGCSYFNNVQLNNIDFATFHLYPDGWGISPMAGNTWIKDHLDIASSIKKPALLGEFGVKQGKEKTYAEWLNSLSASGSGSALVWHYLHPQVKNSDGYGFNETDAELMKLFENHIAFLEDSLSESIVAEEITLFQNYPNPFNSVTKIRYVLSSNENISLELFNSLGERIAVLDEGMREKGVHELTLSFERMSLASGAYFYSLVTPGARITKKLLLLK